MDKTKEDMIQDRILETTIHVMALKSLIFTGSEITQDPNFTHIIFPAKRKDDILEQLRLIEQDITALQALQGFSDGISKDLQSQLDQVLAACWTITGIINEQAIQIV